MSLTQRRPLNSITARSLRSPVTSERLALHSPSYKGLFLEIGAADLPSVAQVRTLFFRQNATFSPSWMPSPQVD